MSMRNLAAAAVVFAALTAIFGCGGQPPGFEAESSQSALTVPVGTHRAVGSFDCQGTRFTASTSVWISGTTLPGRWQIFMSADTALASGVVLDMQGLPVEADDNGFVVYNAAQSTIYTHRKVWPFPMDPSYAHDMSAPPYAIQFWQADGGHPLGQLVVAMYPQGASNSSIGECAVATTAYLTLQP